MKALFCLLVPCLALPAQFLPFYEVGGPGQQQPLEAVASLVCPGLVCDRLTMRGRTNNFYSVGAPHILSTGDATGCYSTLRVGGTMEFVSFYQDPAWGPGSYWPLFMLNWRESMTPEIGPALPWPLAMPLRDLLFIDPVGAYVDIAHSASTWSHAGSPVEMWSTFVTIPWNNSLWGLTFSGQYLHLGTMVLSNEWLVTITL